MTPHDLLSSQHPFVSQQLTRTLAIELLDMASNPVLQTSHTMDECDLEVSSPLLSLNVCLGTTLYYVD